jgi:hypothetical protein
VNPRCALCDVIGPIFGPPGSKTGTHCDIHKPSGYVSRLDNPCSSCGLPYYIKTDALCRNCDPAVQRNKNLREEKIKTFLSARFSGREYRHDKGIPDRTVLCQEPPRLLIRLRHPPGRARGGPVRAPQLRGGLRAGQAV